MSMKQIQFGGTVYIELQDSSGVPVSGIRKFADVWPLTINIASETKSKKSGKKETYGQILHTKTSITDTSGNIRAHDYDVDTVALALSAEKVALSGSGGTASDEAITLIEDEWVEVANKGGGISNVVITGSVLGVDFEVNRTLGMIRMLSAGNLTAGANTVSYEYAAESGYQLKIAKNAQTRARLLLDGVDVETGDDLSGEFYSAIITSNGDFALIHDPDAEQGEIDLAVIFETPEGKDCPGVLNGLQLHKY